MRLGLTIVVALLVAVKDSPQAKNPDTQFYRSFECLKGYQCRRTSKPLSWIDQDNLRGKKNEHTSLAACRLVCGDNAGLWPIPTGSTSYGSNYVRIHPEDLLVDSDNVPISTIHFSSRILATFVSNLKSSCGAHCERGNSTLNIRIVVETEEDKLNWSTNEAYTLIINTEESKVYATIVANTIYGARHGFETLTQLTAPIITPGGGHGLVILDQAHIEDFPVFPHRGLLIDTARNFLPVYQILKTIDALAATKMNVLHWHLTDSQSFPLQIRSRPLMVQYGAYSSTMIYTLEDVEHIVSYGKIRGVRVIIELDSPSHVGAGWEWGPSEGLGKIAVCVNRQPWRDFCIQPPCGQINPVNPKTFDVLRDIYREVLSVMGTESMIHVGGDEVYINCWNATPEVTSVMESRGMGRKNEDFLQLWGEFHTAQAKILDDLKRQNHDKIILWSSALTSPEVIERHLDKKKFVIQTWVESTSEMPNELLKLGYQLIMSTKNAWYLDHGFWGRTQYHTWRDAYNNRIPRSKGVLGGEACMWGEYVNAGGFDTRVWPRTAAVAERLWSDPLGATTADAEPRLQAHRMRLERRGIFTDALAPEWCAQHERSCA